MAHRAGPLRAAIETAKRRFEEWPDEPAAFVFEFIAKAGVLLISLPLIGIVIRRLGFVLSVALEAIAPAMPLDIRSSNSFSKDPKAFYWNIFKYTAPLTMLFCYGANAILTIQCGTFKGSDAHRLYFLYDGFNALLYIVVCPLYVATSICLIIITALSWHEINAHYTGLPGERFSASGYFSASTRAAGFVAISFLITGLYISSYIDDLADPKKVAVLYWFFNEVAPGVRALNKDGYYYTLMNAFLLFITSMAAFCYIAISIEMFKLGKHIDSSSFSVSDLQIEPNILKLQEQRLIITLADFAYSYVMAKLLVLTYAFNCLVWQISPAGKVSNMHSAIVALLIIGLFFLVLPSLYLNRKWHWLKVDYAKRMISVSPDQDTTDIEYENLRPKKYRRFAMLLDMLSGILLLLILKSQYDFTDFWDVFAHYWKMFWFGE